jgi:pimeloyl-ACP methyl ester carboxylesterase
MAILCAAGNPKLSDGHLVCDLHGGSLALTKGALARDRKLEIVNTRTGQVLPLYTDVLDDVERHGRAQLDIRGAAGRVRAPWLILHGAADPTVPVAEAEALRGEAKADLARLLIIPEAGHTMGAVIPSPA